MSLFPKTCPHCDAGPGRYVNIYLCGTYLRAGEDDRKLQTKRCTARERARLAARVAELEARCKRLEEAVESLLPYAEATDDESSEWAPGRWQSEKLKRIIDEARKAKEAKP